MTEKERECLRKVDKALKAILLGPEGMKTFLKAENQRIHCCDNFTNARACTGVARAAIRKMRGEPDAKDKGISGDKR